MTAKDGANPSRFLAAGYLVVVPTYRSRDVDPQSPVSLDDSLAMVEFVRALPYVDRESIVVFGCSGGGDLALEVAARTKICVAVPEEPASVVMAGMFNSSDSRTLTLTKECGTATLVPGELSYCTVT